MALEVGVNVIYQSSTETARRDWDAFIAYTQQHQPTVNVAGIPTSPTGQATATTFGGGSTIAAPVGATYGAGFVGAVGNSTTAATNAQASAHAAAAANAQDFISRMNQAPATPPDIGDSRSVFQMRHPLGPFGGGGSGGYDSRQSMGSQGSPFAEIPPPPGGTPSPAAQAQRYELATTNAAQRGPGGTASGAGGRMWVPIGETPDVGMPGYGAGPRALRGITSMGDPNEDIAEHVRMRANQRAAKINMGWWDEEEPYDPDDIGWSYNPGKKGSGGGDSGSAFSSLKQGIGRGAAALEITRTATALLNTGNQYNIQSAGSSSFSDFVGLESDRQKNNILNNLPWPFNYSSEFGSAIRESATGENAALGGTLNDLSLQSKNEDAGRTILYSGWQYKANIAQMQGQNTGDPSLVLSGMNAQRQYLIDRSDTEYQKALQEKNQQIDTLANTNRRGYFRTKGSDIGEDVSAIGNFIGSDSLSGVGRSIQDFTSNPELSGADKDKYDTLVASRNFLTRQHNQDIAQIAGTYEGQTSGFDLSQRFRQLGIYEDIQDRNRQTQASGFAGRMMPITAGVMNEITSDRRNIEDFNVANRGSEPWLVQARKDNTASVIAQQQQSLANLEFQMRIPGKGEEVSGYTMFGDFSNVGYQDAQKALAAALGGKASLNDADQLTNNLDTGSTNALIQAITDLTTTIRQNGGSSGGAF